MVFERLPGTVVPVNYNIELQPYLDEFRFDGDETITVEVKEEVDKVIVNAREIKIQNAEFHADGEMINVDVKYEEKDEKIIFQLKKAVQKGTYQLKVKFSGMLNDELRGFYRTKHKLADGKERNGAITHFEATGARRAFPCFDEPALRATFDVTLVVPSDRVALSNMPVKSEKAHSSEGWKVMQYDTTPIMPTYLVAFVVGDYHRASCVDEDGVKVTVYTPPGKSEQGIYAAKVAATTMPFYKEYFGVPYGLPKLDLVAAPDFPIGAMENWGLVIYRERALLLNALETSAPMKEYIAMIIGHELAHNWFGNLVTMNWWTHLWLKEGFATWIEYLCVDHCFPEFCIWEQFTSSDLARALRLDALDSSHPIEIKVGDPGEVDEIFDAISYSKGASIINMLHDYLGDDDFRKGLKGYLQEHQFGSACTEDLWRALEGASGKRVGAIMATWTAQKGFPVLKVTEKQSEGQERRLEITQQKFSSSQQQSGEGSLWVVPVSILLSSGEVKKLLMEGASLTVPLPGSLEGWVKVNAGTKGVYRVQYSADMLTKLVSCIRERHLHPTDCLGIISDLFALCEVGLTPTVEVLDLVKAFRGDSLKNRENNFTVWRELLTNLNHLKLLLEYHPGASPVFTGFLLDLLLPTFSVVGWEETDPGNEDHVVSKMRELVVTTLGLCGEPTVVKKALDAFKTHLEGTALIHSNMRRPVYCTVMAESGEQYYSKMKEMYKATSSAEEKINIAGAFSSSRDPAILEDALKFALSEDVRSQDSPGIMARISGRSAQGRDLAWKAFRDNYQMLYQRYSSSLLLAGLVKNTTEGFASEEKAVEIEEFFKKHPAASAERTVQQSCEKIRLNARWLKREAESVVKYLEENPLPTFPDESGSPVVLAKSEETQDRIAKIKVELLDI